MGLQKLTEERLFQNHTKEEIQTWVRQLKYFHYMRARAGHSCEGDSFAVHFRYEGIDDLICKMATLGLQLNELNADVIVFDPFGSYSIDDLDKIKYPIPGTRLEQPKDVLIFGYKAFIWVHGGQFEISISGLETENAYEVSDKDFQTCLKLEKEFNRLAWNSFIDEAIKSHAHCISEKNYPELYLD